MNIKLIFSGAVHKNIRIRGMALEFWAEKYFDSQLKDLSNTAAQQILIEFSEDFLFFPDKRQIDTLLREGECIKVLFDDSWMKISTSSEVSEERSISFSEIADDFYSLSFFKISREILNLELFLINFQISDLLEKGVIIENFSDFYIEPTVKTGRNVFIGSGAVIKGDSVIGDNSVIYPSCFIENSVLGSDTTLLPGSVIRDSSVGKNVVIGPYTHLRQNTKVMDNCKMGNFVEMKKSVFGEGSKSMHLSYIGDASVGKRVNIGAGTITCNYDGVNKNPTTIGDDVFVGSGTELVAPVTLEDRSYVGAGSTITENVPKEALAVSRTRQRHIKNWYAHRKRK